MKKASQQLSTIFCVAKEMVRNHGEDSFYYAVDNNDFIVSAFDGCGGSGSKKYANYSGMTGAYVASRAVSGGTKGWFEKSRDENQLSQYIARSMKICKGFADKAGRIMGSLGKAFPTTAAIVSGEMSKSCVNATCMWAGDSRCYMLNKGGLHQLTEDDLDGQDAMSNLLNDGVMTNVICADSNFELHSKSFSFNYPCILFSATDGCFGYLNSPMEFEYLLLETLSNAESLFEWKIALYDSMNAVAGDDFTLCLAAFGFKDFNDLKKHFVARKFYMEEMYINSTQDNTVLWEEYKKDYSMM